MDSDVKVSVVIPVYNVEAYLERCVDSVLAQSLSGIEIILVDDGSPDGCPEICDDYAAKDGRVYTIHKENGGLASARNAGMDVAKGRYLFFLDSDDWLEPEALEELVIVADRENVDFVRFRPMYAGWPGISDGTLCDFGTEGCLRERKYGKEDMIRDIYPILIVTPELSLGPVVASWRSLYSMSFLREKDLRFDEQVRYSEDSIFSAKVVRAARNFYYLDGPRYYHYYYNPGSITRSFRADRWDSCKKLMDTFDEAFGDDPDYDFSSQLALQKIYCVLSALGQRKLIDDTIERENYIREICNDPKAREAMRSAHLVQGTWKLRILLRLIKRRHVHLLAKL